MRVIVPKEEGGESSRGVGGGGAGGGGPPTGTVGTSGRSPARRASRSGSGLVEVVRDLSPPGERCRDALAPRRCGRGVQEDQRGPPALEGGVMTPAGAAALAALVDLPARPRVPASSGAAGPHDSPGAVRRAVLAGAVLVVLVVGNQLHRGTPPASAMTTKDLEGERKDVRFVKGGLARAIRTLRAAVGPRPRIASCRSRGRWWCCGSWQPAPPASST